MIHSMSETRAISRADLALTLVVGAVGAVLMVVNVVSPASGIEPASWPIVPAFLLVTLPLLWRGQAPLAALGAVLGATAVHVAVFGEAARCGVTFPLVWLLVFSAATRLPGREAAAGLGVGLVALLTMTLADGVVVPSDLAVFGPATAALWVVGRLVRSRVRLADELRARTVELREARDERARLEIATDRARLSTDLDELLQRRLGELSRMAAAGGGEMQADEATAALAAIEAESRRTLDEMRAVVGVLRADEAAPTSPPPTLTHLDALLVRAKGDGARLKVEGSPRALPAGVELSAYRVVEHLLDALEDAGDVEVTVRFGDEALELSVAGPAGRRSEAAIERARERVKLHHGTLTASTRSGRCRAIALLRVSAGT